MWVGKDIQRHISSQEKEPYPTVIELSYLTVIEWQSEDNTELKSALKWEKWINSKVSKNNY